MLQGQGKVALVRLTYDFMIPHTTATLGVPVLCLC